MLEADFADLIFAAMQTVDLDQLTVAAGQHLAEVLGGEPSVDDPRGPVDQPHNCTTPGHSGYEHFPDRQPHLITATLDSGLIRDQTFSEFATSQQCMIQFRF